MVSGALKTTENSLHKQASQVSDANDAVADPDIVCACWTTLNFFFFGINIFFIPIIYLFFSLLPKFFLRDIFKLFVFGSC